MITLQMRRILERANWFLDQIDDHSETVKPLILNILKEDPYYNTYFRLSKVRLWHLVKAHEMAMSKGESLLFGMTVSLYKDVCWVKEAVDDTSDRAHWLPLCRKSMNSPVFNPSLWLDRDRHSIDELAPELCLEPDGKVNGLSGSIKDEECFPSDILALMYCSHLFSLIDQDKMNFRKAIIFGCTFGRCRAPVANEFSDHWHRTLDYNGVFVTIHSLKADERCKSAWTNRLFNIGCSLMSELGLKYDRNTLNYCIFRCEADRELLQRDRVLTLDEIKVFLQIGNIEQNPGPVDMRSDISVSKSVFLGQPERSLLELMNTPLPEFLDWTAVECATILKDSRSAIHNRLLFSYLNSRNLPLIPESNNTISDICRLLNVECRVVGSDLNKTPDVVNVYEDEEGVRHVRVIDVSLTQGNINNVISEKVSKYEYFRTMESPSVRVEISAYVRKFSPNLVSDDLSRRDLEFVVVGISRFLAVEEHLSTYRSDFDEIWSIMEESTGTDRVPFMFTEIDEVKQQSCGFWRENFETFEEFLDFKNKRGRFSYFENTLKEETPFFQSLCSAISARIQKKSSRIVKIEQPVIELAVKAFKEEYEMNISGKVVLSHPPTFAKLVPFPYLCVTRKDRDERRTSCFDLIKSGTMIPRVDSLTKEILELLQDAFIRMDTDEIDDFVHGPKCPERVTKKKLEKLGEEQKILYNKFKERQERANAEDRVMVKGRRKIQLPKTFWTKSRNELLALETGEGALKIFGKDKEKQFEHESWYSLECDTEMVSTLKDWMCDQRHRWDTSALDMSEYRSTVWELERSIRQESDRVVNEWLKDLSHSNLFSMSEFYQLLFKEFAFMSEDISRHKEIILSSLGSIDTLVIMWGGPSLSSAGTSRVVQIIKKMNVADDFPLNCCGKYTKEGGLYVMSPVRITEQQIAHYIKCHKSTIDSTLGSLIDSGRSYNDLSEGDRENYFFSSAISRMSNDKSISTSLLNIRYIGMALMAEYGDLIGMMKKSVEPGRKLLYVYIWQKVLSNLLIWKENTTLESDIAIQAQNIIDGTGERRRSSKCFTKRLLSDGNHISFDETVNEWYYGHGASKEIRNHYHEMARAINKLVETYGRYNYTKTVDPNLVRGYSIDKNDSEFIEDVLDSDVKIGTWSMRATYYASKLLEQETDGDFMRIKQNILYGDLKKPVMSMATTKSIVAERTEKVVISKKTDKTVNSSGATPKNSLYSETMIERMKKDKNLENSRYRRMGDLIIPTRCMMSDKKTKTIGLFYKAIYENDEVKIDKLIQKVYKTDTPFYFTLFPKAQKGTPREIAIQDLMTRLTTYVMERVSEEINKNIESESLTDSDKFLRQESYISECRKENVNTRRSEESTLYTDYIYNNEDNTRWGPGMIPLMFAVVTGQFARKVSKECYDFFLNGCMQMTGKMIEIPKCIYEKWDNNFKPHPSNPMYDFIMRYKADMSIKMEIPVGMMQGILHECSSTLAVARIALTKRVLSALYPGIFKIRSMAGSDDKFDAVSIVVDRSIPGDYDDKCRAFLSVNEMTGKLMNIWRSGEKSVMSKTVGEMNSNFIFDGDTATRCFTEYNSIATIGKGISYESDVRSGIASLATLARANCSEVNLCLFQRTLKMQIDDVYQTGKKGKNSVEDNYAVLREYLPIEIGGFPVLTGPSLALGPIECHNFKVCHFGNSIERDSLIHLATFEDSSIYNVFSESGQISDLTGVSKTSINFAIRIVSKVENLAKQIESYGFSRDVVRKDLEDKPYIPFIVPNNSRLTLVRLASQIYSFSSLVAFSYSTDTSNQVRMAKNATSPVCHLGHYKKTMESGMEGDKSVAVDKMTFLQCCKSVLDASVNERQRKSFESEIKLAFSDNTLLMSVNSLMSAWRIPSMNAYGDGYYKTRWSTVSTPHPTPGTKNSASSVLTAMLFPEAEKDSMNLLRSPLRKAYDFQKLRERYPYLRETMEETCACIYDIPKENVTEEQKKTIYTHLMSETMSSQKKRIQLRTQCRGGHMDDRFLAEHMTTSICKGRIYTIVKVNDAYDVPLRVGSTILMGRDEINRTKIVQSMASTAMYIRNRVLENYKDYDEDFKMDKIHDQTVNIFRSSSIDVLSKIESRDKYYSFYQYINECDIEFELSKLETTSLTQAFLSIGANFSRRCQSYIDAFMKISSGWSYFYPIKVSKNLSKRGIKYSPDKPSTLTALSPKIYFDYERTKTGAKLTIEHKQKIKEFDFTEGMKLIQNYTAYGHFSCSTKVALASQIEFGSFVVFNTILRSPDEHLVVKRGIGVSIKLAKYIKPTDLVYNCKIEWKNLSVNELKALKPFEPVYSPCLIRTSITHVGLHKGTITDIDVARVRDGLFDPSIIFSSDRDKFQGAAGELKAFMDAGLFSGRCRGVELDTRKGLSCFEIHKSNWIDALMQSNMWMHDVFDCEVKVAPLTPVGSSDSDSDVSQSEFDPDDFEYDIGDDEDFANKTTDFLSHAVIETIDFKMPRKGKSSVSIERRIHAAEITLMQEYSKVVVMPRVKELRKRFGEDHVHSSCMFIAANCLSYLNNYKDEEYLGDDFKEGMNYSDCFDPVNSYKMTSYEINNAIIRYKRLKYTCVAYSMLTVIKNFYTPRPIINDSKIAWNSLASELSVPSDCVIFGKFEDGYKRMFQTHSTSFGLRPVE